MSFDYGTALSVAVGVFVAMSARDMIRGWVCRHHFLQGARAAEKRHDPRAPAPTTMDPNVAYWAGYKDQMEGESRWKQQHGD